MKHLFFLIITLLITNTISSQQYSDNLFGEGLVNFSTFYNRAENKTTSGEIDGSQYLNEEFSMATINPIKGSYPIRYNAVFDIFEVKKLDDNIIILNKSNLEYLIKIGNDYYKSFKFKDSKDGYGYFNLVTRNKAINLLKRTKKTFHKEKKAVSSYTVDKNAYFSEARTSLYVYFKKDDILKELPTRTKHFIALFPGKENTIKKFIKSEKLNLKKESDVIKVINFVNTI